MNKESFEATDAVPRMTLRDGRRIPQLGFGTLNVPPDRTPTPENMAITAGDTTYPFREQRRTQKLAAERPENLPRPRAARRNDRWQTAIAGLVTMQPRRIGLAVALFGLSSVSAQAADFRVTMEGLGYAPAEVKAKVGDTIVWVNKDFVVHTATAKNKDWDVLVAPDKTVRMVLNKPGEVDYYCKFHPNMQGHVTVTN